MPKNVLLARIVVFLVGLLVFSILVVLGMFGYLYRRSIVESAPQIGFATPTLQSLSPTPTPDPMGPFTVLLLGYGGGTHEGGKITDTMILAHVVPRAKKVDLISLPRDIWVQLPLKGEETVGFKINAAYPIGLDDRDYPDKPEEFTGEGGGGSLAKYAVSQVSGLRVDYFVALSFNGFVRAIDTLGGVEVDVPHMFDDAFYPIEGKEEESCGLTEEDIAAVTATMSGLLLDEKFSCRFEHLHFDAGEQVMDGATALKFVRSRKSPQSGGDFNRALRQQALLLGVREKVLSLNFIPKAWPVVNELGRDVQTDIGPGVASEKLQIVGDLREYEINQVVLTTDNVLIEGRSADRQFILLPKAGEGNWEEVHGFVREKINSDGHLL